MGYHTFAFFQKVQNEEFSSLTTDFIAYANRSDDIKRVPKKNGWEYTYKERKGIRWRLVSFQDNNGFMVQGVTVVINPRVLIDKNYIVASEEDDLDLAGELYNREAEKISPILLKFGECSLNRADVCLNIDLNELGISCTPEQMMFLIKQGNIPKHYIERKENRDDKQHRKTTDKDSFYLMCKSATINYYWKYPKQNEKHPNFSFRELSRNVIRLEVQYKYLKLYMLSKNIKHESKFYVSGDNLSIEQMYERLVHDMHNPSIPIDVVLSEKVYDDIVRKNFNRILRKGDYFTLDGAESIIKSYHFRPDKEERIIETLEFVNECRGIAKAKSKLHGSDLNDFNRTLRDLDNMWINPVTIPRRWKIRYIPNLLRAYDEACYEERLLFKSEYEAWKHIDDFLSR